MKYSIKSLLILAILTSNYINAQWIKTNGPAGGNVRSIIHLDGNFYAATWGNGIFISKNNGLSWGKTYKTNEMFYIFALTSTDSTLIMGSDGQGIFISQDKGTSWTFSALPRNHVWEFLTAGKTVYAVAESGIYFTKDKGTSWTKFNPNQSIQAPNCIQIKGDTLYSGTNYGIYHTSISGGNWIKISQGLGKDSVVNYMVIKDNFIFAGTEGGVYRSSDNGTVWTKYSNGLGESSITALFVNGNDILAGTYYGAFISQDNGLSWQKLQLGNQNIWCFYRKDEKIYAGTGPGGIYVSADNSKTWTQLSLFSSYVSSVIYNGNRLIAATDGGIFYSADKGTSWDKSEGLPYYFSGGYLTRLGTTLFVTVNPNYSLVSDLPYGIYMSSDNGKNWSITGLKSDDVRCISSSGNKLFAGLADGFYTSADSGKNWTKSVSGLAKYPNIRSIFPSGSKIYISATDSLNKVFVSEDEGKTWKGLGLGLKNTGVNSVAKIDNYLFASSDYQGVFVSSSDGIEWKGANNGLNAPYTCMLLNVEKSLFTITNNQVFVSNDNASSWSNITGDMDARYARNLAIGGTELYAGTFGDGVWKRPLSGLLTDINNTNIQTPVEYSLEQNYPNPFNPSTTISYSIPRQSFVELKVHDMLGREVSTIVNEQESAGVYKVQFNGSSLPSGLYIYTLQAGSFRDSKKLLLLK